MVLTPLAVALSIVLPSVQNSQKAEFGRVFGNIEIEIERNYYAREKRREFMEDMINRYRPRAQAAKTREEFSDTVNEMIDKFEDSHFDFFPSTEQGYYLMSTLVEDTTEMPNVGLWFGEEETINGMTGRKVLMVMNGSEAQKLGVRKGDFILNTTSDQQFEPVESLRDKQSVSIRIGRSGPQSLVSTRMLTLPVSKESVPEMFFDAMKESERIIPVGAYKVGYVRLWTLMRKEFRAEFARALREDFKSTDALIVDLRDGFGGSPVAIAEMLGAAVDDPRWGSRTKQLYSKHVVVLTNNGTRSAKEMVAYNLKKSKRGFLIGQKTAGHVLGAVPRRVADWAMLEIPGMDVMPGTERLERVGVTPHLEVADGYEGAKDFILDRAIQHTREYLEKERAA